MKLLDPKIILENIELEINDNQESYDEVTAVWGRMIPMVRINEYTLNPAEVRNYEFRVNLNSLPEITLVLDDSQFNIRKSFESEYIDLVTIFIGNRDWYHKITCIITDVYSEAGSQEIIVSGTLHIPKLFDTKQDSFFNEKVTDIIYKKCDESDIGLYIIDNKNLSKQVHSIQSELKQIEYIGDVIKQHTDNIWCIDNFYFLHIGNIESMLSQEISTFNFKDGVILEEPLPIKLVSNPYAINGSIDNKNEDSQNTFFKIKSYTINTNIGHSVLNNCLEYYNKDSDNNSVNLFTQNVNESVGSGIKTNNTFSGFLNRFGNNNSTYKSIVNKTLNDKTISLVMEEPLYEITPFMNINLEIVLPLNPDLKEDYNKVLIDKENSGKKTIIGYTMFFNMESSDNPMPLQTITLI